MDFRNRLKQAGIILFAWSVAALLFAGSAYVHFQAMNWKITWHSTFIHQWIYSALWAIYTPLIFFLSRRFPIERVHWKRRLSFHIFCSILIAVTQRAIFSYYEFSHPLMESPSGKSYSFINDVFYQFDYGLLIYWVLLGVQHSLAYYRRSKEQELRASHLESRVIHAELQALKVQLQPQFVFTTLESISRLMKVDMKAADKMIARLGDFLRLTIDSTRAQDVTLQKELDFLRSYLEIEQIRLQGRLKVEIIIEPQVVDSPVPNLLLQPIVEHAIHDGFSTDEYATGRLHIRAKQLAGNLRIEIENSSSELRAGSFIQGFGIASTRSRLKQLYGSDHHFDVQDIPDGGLLVTLDLPIRSEEAVAV